MTTGTTLYHVSPLGGRKPCNAHKRHCPLGGMHMSTEVAKTLDVIEAPTNNYDTNVEQKLQNKTTEEHQKMLKVLDALKKSYIKLDTAHRMINQHIRDTSPEGKKHRAAAEKFAVSIQDEINAITDEHVDPSDMKITRTGSNTLRNNIDWGYGLTTIGQRKAETELANYKKQNFSPDKIKEVEQTYEQQASSVPSGTIFTEFFTTSPDLGGAVTSEKIVGTDAIETYNKAIKAIHVHNALHPDQKIGEKEKTETVTFLREQLKKISLESYNKKSAELKNSSKDGFLNTKQEKALHKEQGVSLKELFNELDNASWSTKINKK